MGISGGDCWRKLGFGELDLVRIKLVNIGFFDQFSGVGIGVS